jgi:hypothetical protein
MHKWAILSGLITLVHILILFGVTHYYFRHGIAFQDMPVNIRLDDLHVYSILGSVAIGIVAAVKERPAILGIIAVCCGLFSYFFFVG